MKKNENELLAVVSVADDQKVICQYENCGRPICKAVHVVRLEGAISVIGSTCYKKSIAQKIPNRDKGPRYTVGGELLSPSDRELLLNNTEALIQQYEDIHQQELVAEQRKAEERQRAIAQSVAAANQVYQSEKRFSPDYDDKGLLPYKLIRKPVSEYPDRTLVPKIRPIIGLAIPPEEIKTMTDHDLNRLAEQAITFVFARDRGLRPDQSYPLFQREVHRLVNALRSARANSS